MYFFRRRTGARGTAPCVDTGEEMQRLGRQGPKRGKEAVREAQETARKGAREGRGQGQRRKSNRGPFTKIPEWMMNKALRSEYDWGVAVSKAVTNLLRHDHHAEVSAHGFMDTGGLGDGEGHCHHSVNLCLGHE